MSEIVKAPTPTAVTNALRVSEFAKLTDILAENGYEIPAHEGRPVRIPRDRQRWRSALHPCYSGSAEGRA